MYTHTDSHAQTHYAHTPVGTYRLYDRLTPKSHGKGGNLGMCTVSAFLRERVNNFIWLRSNLYKEPSFLKSLGGLNFCVSRRGRDHSLITHPPARTLFFAPIPWIIFRFSSPNFPRGIGCFGKCFSKTHNFRPHPPTSLKSP